MIGRVLFLAVIVSAVHALPWLVRDLPWSLDTDTLVLIFGFLITEGVYEAIERRWLLPRWARRMTRKAQNVLNSLDPHGSYVYLIGPEHGAGPWKVGMSTDVRKRLATLQTGSPEPLRVYWATPGGRDLESRLHRVLAPWRKHGEWFDLGPDPDRFIWNAQDHAERRWSA
ncbi:GIY-YIG nuclease family protein [Streptomyces cellulosae]|uniref:GIY-YIG nuclease family protein n=1 Tax=Streptomyces cellulosae TaxID=1968 RepID=UPI0004C7B3A6|nr:GIY-YIG nuclease family protein [Streptomyces cellulosae]